MLKNKHQIHALIVVVEEKPLHNIKIQKVAECTRKKILLDIQVNI